jgi:hypothetical protein
MYGPHNRITGWKKGESDLTSRMNPPERKNYDDWDNWDESADATTPTNNPPETPRDNPPDDRDGPTGDLPPGDRDGPTTTNSRDPSDFSAFQIAVVNDTNNLVDDIVGAPVINNLSASAAAARAPEIIKHFVPLMAKYGGKLGLNAAQLTYNSLKQADPEHIALVAELATSIICPIITESLKKAGPFTKVVDESPAGLLLECVDDTKVEFQLVLTWYNDRWARNPHGKIQQGWHPKQGDQSPDLIGYNIVLDTAVGLRVKYWGQDKRGKLSGSTGVQMAQPIYYGVHRPLTHNGKLETGLNID